MKKNYKSILLLVSLFSLLILYLIHSNLVVKEVLSYTTFFLHSIFPTTFIFLLLSYLLIENNLFYYIQHIIKDKGLYFFFVALISGYPTGAIYLKDSIQKKEITKEEGNKYILFSHFPNPLFVLYHCQKLFPKTNIPLIFYSIIILSNFSLLLLTHSKNTSTETKKMKQTSFINSFQKSLFQTFSTLLLIYGTSIFFYLLSRIITHYFSFHSYVYVLISGTFDLTKGMIMSSIIPDIHVRGVFLFYFVVFGSIPIHLQIKSILSDTSISYKSFLKGRIFSFILCTFLWMIIMIIKYFI